MGKIKGLKTYRIRISRTKERRKLLSEKKTYERIRGYAEMDKEALGEEWLAVRKRDFEVFKKLLRIFNEVIETFFTIEISERTYPAVFDALRKYEKENPDAWENYHGAPKIVHFLKSLTFIRPKLPEEIIEEVKKIGKNIVSKIWSELDPKGLMEVVGWYWGEHYFYVDLLFTGELPVRKHGKIELDYAYGKYILKIRLSGPLFIKNITVE